MTVNDVAPGIFTYSPVDMDLILNQAMMPNTVRRERAVTVGKSSPIYQMDSTLLQGIIWAHQRFYRPHNYLHYLANNTGGSSSTTGQ